jgi:hypothetical protein
MSHSGCYFLAVLSFSGSKILSRQSYPACPVLIVLFCLSFSACPVIPVLFCLSCSAHPVLPIPLCMSYSACFVLPVLFCLTVLFCLFCSDCPVLPVLFFLSCSARPVQPVLFCLSPGGGGAGGRVGMEVGRVWLVLSGVVSEVVHKRHRRVLKRTVYLH